MADINGLVSSVQRVPRGSEIVTAASLAATLIYVDSAEDFDDAGGDLEINGVRYEYLSSDIDLDTITLSTGLTAAAAIGDAVYPVMGGQVATDHIAFVSMGEGDEAEVLIPYGERPLWPEGVYEDPVPVVLSPDLTRIVTVPGRVPVIEDTTFQTGSTGVRVVVRTIPEDRAGIVEFYSGVDGETPGYLAAGLTVNGRSFLDVTPPAAPTAARQPFIGMVSGANTAGAADSAEITLSAPLVEVTEDLLANGSVTAFTSVHGADVYADGQAGVGTVGASLTSQGRLIRTPSTRKVKKDIKPMPATEAAKVLDLEAVTYRLRNDDDTVYPGFIAEQAAEVGADLWVTRDKHGDPNGFRYAEVTAALVALARDQRGDIATLKQQIAELKQQVTALTSTLKLNGKAKP